MTKKEYKKVEILFEDRSFGFLQPLDLRVNARVRRRKDDLEIIPEPPKNDYRGGSLSFHPKEENS
jgi:hypothetical protein